MSLSLVLPDAEATGRLGATIAPLLQSGDAVLLYGPLGMGKSTLARALIRALTTPDEDVPSPTFTLVQFYEADPPVAHFDLYRLSSPDEAFEIGLDEALDEGCVLIEWPERLGDDPAAYLRPDRLTIRLSEPPQATRPHGGGDGDLALPQAAALCGGGDGGLALPQAAALREGGDRVPTGRLATVSGAGRWEAAIGMLNV